MTGIALRLIESVTVNTLMDNVSDLPLPGRGPAKHLMCNHAQPGSNQHGYS